MADYKDSLRNILSKEAERAETAYNAGRRRQAIQIAKRAIAAAEQAYSFPLHTLNSSGLAILRQIAMLGGNR